jgi:HlyD family secretion protein
MMKRFLSLLIVAALAGAGVWAYLYTQSIGNAPKYKLGRVERGPLTAAVSATGNLNAVITVQVGSQVSGQIKELFADFNSVVKKGQVVARIDPDIFEAKVNQAKADLASARAAVLNQQAQVERAREAAWAQVEQKDAALKQARVDLDHTTIYAPVDGVVVSRQVDVGQTVAASLSAPTLFTIAQDLTKMQVETSAWILGRDAKPVPVQLTLGLSDGTFTEVLGGDLNEGQEVVVALAGSAGRTPQPQSGPRLRL